MGGHVVGRLRTGGGQQRRTGGKGKTDHRVVLLGFRLSSKLRAGASIPGVSAAA
jgi:hypothetical protein